MTAWRGDVATGVSAWLGDDERPSSHHEDGNRGPVRGDPVPEDHFGVLRTPASSAGPEVPRPRRRPRVGGPHDPARPADRSGPDPSRAGRQAALAQRPRRDRHPAARPVHRGRADRRRGVRARCGWSQRQSSRGLARRALSDELRRKGVDAEIVREAVDEVDPADEEAAARRLVRKKLPLAPQASTAPPPPDGWSACWPARATPPGWPSRWSRTSWGPRRPVTTRPTTSRLASCPISTRSSTSWSGGSRPTQASPASTSPGSTTRCSTSSTALTARGHELYEERGLLR